MSTDATVVRVVEAAPVVIDVTDVDVPSATAACWEALRECVNPRFVRVQDLACVREGNDWVALSAAKLKFWLSRRARFVKVLKSGEERFVSVPSWIVQDMLADRKPALQPVKEA